MYGENCVCWDYCTQVSPNLLPICSGTRRHFSISSLWYSRFRFPVAFGGLLDLQG